VQISRKRAYHVENSAVVQPLQRARELLVNTLEVLEGQQVVLQALGAPAGQRVCVRDQFVRLQFNDQHDAYAQSHSVTRMGLALPSARAPHPHQEQAAAARENAVELGNLPRVRARVVSCRCAGWRGVEMGGEQDVCGCGCLRVREEARER
jgi:hypothetical protein